ncbi:MAG: MotA/TolQ/ExbB proton channel family protein, partial [Mailhella sp.]|nr:MotA/TolQ/ExbB proton channel family protein [Mailhella sp.]
PAASLMPGSSDLIRELISSGDYPTQEQIRQLSKLFFDEIVHGGKLTMAEGSVLLADGTPVEASILRIGALCSAARLADGTITFLLPSSGGSTLSVADSKLPSAIRSQLKEYMDGSSQFVPADFSGGDVLRRFDTRKSLINHVKDGGALAWPILGLGLLGLLLGLWRMTVLFGVKKGDPVVLKEFFTHARHGRWNEAKLLLEGKESSTPVYKLLLHMLCHWNGTTTSLEKCRDEAVLIAIGPLEKYIPFVAVVAAVAPLLGLLGTVTGMISTFDVITIFGNSDPTLLSGGISVALVTTELGLIVAIPLLLLHHFLSRRVDAIVNELEEEGAVLVARASASIQDDIKAESRA